MVAYDFPKEKLICGILFNSSTNLNTALDFLKANIGEIDYQSPDESFSKFTTYYNDEIGGEVFRVFVSFKELVDPSSLADIKLKTNSFEAIHAINNKRPINLDPGLISTGRLILATTKNASHRIALHSGIYVEMTLFFSKNEFTALPWTYPDFSSDDVRHHMFNIRNLYKKQYKQPPPISHQ